MGHEEVLSPGKALYEAIKSDQVFSFILYAPPGSGKTTLCRLIKAYTKSRFISLSAVTSGVKDVKAVIDEAQAWLDRQERRSIVFIDEIHRFNKSQQDALLHAVESGTITLIGATTENPSYALNSALLSRVRVFRFERLKESDLKKILRRACSELGWNYPEQLLDLIAERSQGDARSALSALELSAEHPSASKIEEFFQSRHLSYDKAGDEHYQVISAFIKSMRASKPEASMYYLARMWKGGEDPLFIARRMVIFASEDIGNADLRALAMANAVRNAVEFIGRPECFYALAQGALYLSKAPKSREAGDEFEKAMKRVERRGSAKVPDFLVNPVSRLDRDLGRGRKAFEGESFLPQEVEEEGSA